MSRKIRVMIIAHFCDYGEEKSNNRFNYLANLLSTKGYEVELVTSSFSHRDKVQRQKNIDGNRSYKTTLIYEPSYQKNISLKRLFISHRVMAQNLRKYMRQCVCPDIVYCAIPSINVAEVASEYAEEKHIPFVIDVQDLWPEAYRLILKRDVLYRLVTHGMKKRIDRVYQSADRIIAVSDTYAQRAKAVNAKCVDAITVYLGTEKSAFDNAVRHNTTEYTKREQELWIGYCGTLGHSYDLTTVMEAMKILADRGMSNIRLLVIGSGPLEETFRQKANELGISCTFVGKLPYGMMCAQLSQCDIAVNPIAKGAAQSIINKHADYAMAGLPVINTQECEEYRNLLATYDCGINCDPESTAQIADAIDSLANHPERRAEMHQNAYRMGEEKFDRAKTYGAILKVIENML